MKKILNVSVLPTVYLLVELSVYTTVVIYILSDLHDDNHRIFRYFNRIQDTAASISWAEFSSAVDRCRTRPGRKSSNWLIPEPDPVIYRESYRCPTDVCRKS